MKKIIASFLVVALLVPGIVVAAPPPIVSTEEGGPSFVGSPEYAAEQAGIANLTGAGDVVGCDTGGFGGALAQTFGAALQQAIPGFIRGKLQGPLSKLASQAGPFGGLVNSLGNMAINKLSSFVQSKLGQVFGGKIGDALGAVTGGVVPGVGAGAAAVPVNTVTADPILNRVDTQTKKTEEATQTSAQVKCVGNPTIAKLKNALLSMIYRSIIDFANGGFNGEQAIIGNIQQFAKEGVEGIVQRFVSEATAGICSTDRAVVQTILLEQYEYEVDYTKQSQCPEGSDQEYSAEDIGDSEKGYNAIFQPQSTTFGSVMLAESALKQQRSESAFKSILTFIVGDGVKPSVMCNDGTKAVEGNCPGGIYDGTTVLTGEMNAHIIKKAITGPIDQLLNADEIGELIDSFTAGLTQFIFQGIDGLAGASKKSSSGGSYLDSMVSATTGGATNQTKQVITSDILSAKDVEQEYLDTVTAAVTRVTQIKTSYTTAIACYQVALNSSNQAFAQERINNASSTIATILNPQITSLNALKQKSQAALSAYDDLLTRLDATSSQDEVLAVYTDYQALISSGQINTPVTLAALQNGITAADPSLTLLSTDAGALLTECRAL